MAAPGWIQFCRRGSRAAGHCLASFALWSLWLLLLVLAGFQARVLWAGEVRVPNLLTRQLEQQLATHGLETTLGSIILDPRGRLLVRDLDLHAPGTTEPLLTARAVYGRFDPWELLVGRIDLARLELVGARLHVPAMLSPSGRAEPVIDNAHLTLAFDGPHRCQLVELVTRVGSLPLIARGDWLDPHTLPRPAGTAPTDLSDILRRLARQAQQAAVQLSRLPPHDDPRLTLVLQAEDAAAPTLQGQLHLNDFTWLSPPLPPAFAGPVTGREVAVRFTLPLAMGPDQTWTAAMEVAALAHPYWGEAHGLSLQATTPGWAPGGQPENLAGRLQIRTVRHGDFAAHALLGEVTITAWPRADLHLHGFLAGQPWAVEAHHDPQDEGTALRLDADIDPALVAWAGRLAGRDLSPLLSFDSPGRFHATGRLDPAGQPVSAAGWLHGGPAVFRGAALDFARTDFAWRDHRLHATDIGLHAGSSHVRGSYEMDTKTRDFRFLLAGALEPATVNRWFRSWWTNLWANFAFPAAAPAAATLDSRGRWGDPDRARVFVAVDAAMPAIRGVPFTRVRTRLFARPEFTDVLALHAERPQGEARGAITVDWDQRARANRQVTLDLHSGLDLDVLARLLPAAGPRIVAPFALTHAPRLHIRGRVNGAAALPGAPATDLAITAAVEDAWTLLEFPLQGASFRVRYTGDRVLVEDALVGFAGGMAEGRVEIAGLAPDRRLSFDLALRDAGLGEAIRDLEVWGAGRQGLPVPPRSRFQQRTADGRLNLALSATGPFGQPLKFAGEGFVDITEASLGEVNLLGILSTLLRRTLLDFSTLELDTARSNFTLAGDRVFFPDLILTGPRAAINASGDYQLATRQLAFNARVQPFEAGRGLLGSTVGLVLSPLSHVLEVRLSGSLADPSWAFTYGPRSLLRALDGSEPSAPSPPATPSHRSSPDEG